MKYINEKIENKMENNINKNTLELTNESLESLKTWANMSRKLGILGYIYMCILLICAAVGFIGAAEDLNGGAIAFGVLIFGICLWVFYILIKKFKIGGEIILEALNDDSPEDLEDGLDTLASGFKFQGSLMIVCCVIYALAIIASIFSILFMVL